MKLPAESLAWRTDQPCRWMIVSENAAAEQQARGLWSQLVQTMHGNVPSVIFHRTTGQPPQSPAFGHDDLTNLMILSVHDLPRFLLEAAAWLNDWLNVPSTHPRALFVLHGEKEDSPVIGMLRKLAQSAGVTLFSIAAEEAVANTMTSLWWINFG